MISMSVDTAKITALQTKFQKYGPYAIKQGLKSATDYLNTPTFKQSMYPPSQSGSPFVWSSDKQRRYVFANVNLPYSRTYGLANSGEFKVNEQYFTVEYSNSMPSWIYVLHPTHQIIGHRMRGWKPVHTQVKDKSPEIVRNFKTAAINAWKEMDAFIYGGGAGL